MKRWGVLGLLALAACAGDDSSGEVSEARECPNVVAGSLPVSPVTSLAQNIWASTPGRQQVEDGRQPVIVRFHPDVIVSAALVERTGGQVQHTFRAVPALAARLGPSERAALLADPDVVAIEPDVEWHALGTVGSQSAPAPQARGSAGEYTEGLRLVKATSVWDFNGDGALDPGAPTGSGIRVCVIDSGIDPEHPELRSRIVGGKDFVDGDDDPSDREGDVWGEGHGTHVAGTIAAQLDSPGTVETGMDRGGVTGVAPGAELLIARVLNLEGRARLSHVLAAVDWCHQQGAKIASLSLGGGEWGETSKLLFQRVSADMLIIAAAGNDGGQLLYPAAFPSVLAVGAVNGREGLADFSCRGSNLGLVAPGVDVLSTFIRGRGRFAELDVAGARYASRALVFSPSQDITGELVDCGHGMSRASCRGGSCEGFVAYVTLGGARVESVVANVMKQGARAVILGHPETGGEPETLALTPGNWVPGTMVGNTTSVLLRMQLGQAAHVKLSEVDYTRFSGTSMAAPHVSGVAALVWSERPSLSPAQVRDLLQRSAKDLGPNGWDSNYGHGLVQAPAALEALRKLP